jgi:cytochrome b561
MSPTAIGFLVASPLIAWRVYKRVQRLTTRQPSKVWRHWTAAILFPVLVILLGLGAASHPLALVAMAAGLAGGAGLGVLSLRKTVFENVGGEFFYTPHARIGIFVSLLFVGRLLYRGFEMLTMAPGAMQSPDFGRSPLTLLVFGVMAGYYIAYATGLLRWRARSRA